MRKWLEFIKEVPTNLDEVPYHYRNAEICEIAVQNDGLALKYVPKEYITEELCRIAVKNNKYAIGYIPRDILTQEICNVAVVNGTDLMRIPEEFRANIIEVER